MVVGRNMIKPVISAFLNEDNIREMVKWDYVKYNRK